MGFSVTVDAVVFGYENPGKISLLLVKRKWPPHQGKWAIPGGYVLEDESLETAVERELSEETGVTISYLEQLYTFGNPGRDPRGRVVTIAYYALVRPGGFELKADTDAEDAAWFDINELPELAFDHSVIIEKAIERLRGKVTYEPVGFELLDEKFPFSDLENLYAALLNRPIDRRNFRKKVMSYGLITELNEKVKRGAGRPASLFQFDKTRYQELRSQGLYFDI